MIFFLKKGPTARREADRAAQIFMKPSAWRHRFSHRLADAVLRPLVPLRRAASALNTDDARRVLVFDPGGLGDMILLVPFLRCLRARLPGVRITLVGRPGTGSILMPQGLVEEWVPLRIPWAEELSRWKANNLLSPVWARLIRTAWALRSRRFDLGFVTGWSCDLRANLILWLSGARRRIGYGYAGGEFLLTDIVTPDLERPHVADRSLRLLEHLGIPVCNGSPDLWVAPEDERYARDLIARHGVSDEDLLIGVHSGAGLPLREWGDERFAALGRWAADHFGARILWFRGPRFRLRRRADQQWVWGKCAAASKFHTRSE